MVAVKNMLLANREPLTLIGGGVVFLLSGFLGSLGFSGFPGLSGIKEIAIAEACPYAFAVLSYFLADSCDVYVNGAVLHYDVPWPYYS